MDDALIIELLKTDDREGIRVLIDKYNRTAVDTALSVLKGRWADAEEAAADAFFSIWKRRMSLEPGRGSLRGLVIVAARNNAINIWRRSARDPEPLPEGFDAEGGEGDALERLIAEEESDALHAEILKLPEPDREIFVRRYYLMEAVGKIGERLGIEEKQVSNRLYRSKLKLRKALSGTGVIKI